MIPTASTKKIIMERDIDAFQNKNRIIPQQRSAR